MTRYFSRSKGGFYDDAIHGEKGKKGSLIPKDAVAVDAAEHVALLAEQASGKRIVAGENGAPMAIVPQLSPDELLAQVRARRDRELARTDWTQMGDAALGQAQRKLWAEHRQALRELPARIEAAVAAGKPADSVAYPVAPAIAAPAGEGAQLRQAEVSAEGGV